MKRALLLCCCCCLIVFGSQAQSDLGVRFGVQGNYANITIESVDQLKDVYGPGWGGGAHIDFSIPMFTFRLNGDYLAFAADNDKFRDGLALINGVPASDVSVEGGRIDIFSLALNGKFSFLQGLPIVSPYITGGFGMARLTFNETKVTYLGQPQDFPGTSSQTKPQFNAGAGVDVNLVGIAMYLEAKYTWVSTEGETSTYVPVTLGVTF